MQRLEYLLKHFGHNALTAGDAGVLAGARENASIFNGELIKRESRKLTRIRMPAATTCENGELRISSRFSSQSAGSTILLSTPPGAGG